MALLAEPNLVTDLLPQYDIPATQLTAAMRLVAGWLREDAGLETTPDALTDADDLFSPALELVSLVVTNPELLSSRTVGPTMRTWPIIAQRDRIRNEIRTRYASTGGPRGTFPPALPWPDPIVSVGWWDPVTASWIVPVQ